MVFGQLESEARSGRSVILYVGATSAYTTIQSALDAAEPGDTIVVANGIYYESITINKSNVKLIGGSNTECKIINHFNGKNRKNNSPTDLVCGIDVTTTGISIENFNISVSVNNTFGIGVMMYSSSNINIIDNHFYHTYLYRYIC